MKKVLVTGASGMAGSHLTELLVTDGYQVTALVRHRSCLANLALVRDQVTIRRNDVLEYDALADLIREEKFYAVFHLAGQSFVPASWDSPVRTMEVNVIGTMNLLEAVRRYSPSTRVHVACSSEQYGFAYEHELPIKESNPFRPMSPYAVSKIAEEHLALQYARNYDLTTIVTRAFNQEGPRRWFVSGPSNFAKQIAEMERKTQAPVLYVGNLASIRDYLDVRDAVQAYVKALELGPYNDPVNVCSGKGVSLQDIVDQLAQLTPVRFEIKVDRNRVREPRKEVPRLIGDCSKFQLHTNWKPVYSLDVTLRDMLDYWRTFTA